MLCHLLQMYFVFLILAGRFWLEFLDFRSRVSRTALALFIFPNINYRRRIDINDVCNKMKGLSTFFLRWLLFHEWTSTSEALMVVLGLVSSSLMCVCVYFLFYFLFSSFRLSFDNLHILSQRNDFCVVSNINQPQCVFKISMDWTVKLLQVYCVWIGRGKIKHNDDHIFYGKLPFGSSWA